MSFIKQIRTEVNSLTKTYSIRDSDAFSVWSAMIISELDVDDAFDALAVEGPNDKGMDLFWIDQPNRQVFIAQCKYSEKGNHNPKVKDLEALLGCTDWLISPELIEKEGRPELTAAAVDYIEAVENGFATRLWFIYCGERDENIEKRVRAFNNAHKDERRSAIHCDLSLLYSLFQEVRGEDKRIDYAKTVVDTRHFEVEGTFGKGLVTSIGADRLVDLYSQFSDHLFARNVRGWLGARKGSVNAAIIDTAESEPHRGNFWAFNNGISIVCDEYNYNSENGEIELRNFSIVNGCQTTVALVHGKEGSDYKNVSLLTRIISPPELIIDDVIRFTNSQNPIRRWDLASQDRTQRRLQNDFSKLDTPYYYNIRRGAWRALEADERRQYRSNGGYRSLNHDLLAQYLASFKGMAVEAYKDKASLFEKYYEEVFPPDVRVEEGLFVWVAGDITADMVREDIKRENERVGGGEKERDKYMLMLKRGGRFFTLGVFGHVANMRNGPDYLRSIDEKRILSKRGIGRIAKYSMISIQWYKQAVSDLLELGGVDLSILIREKNFFKNVAERVTNLYEQSKVNKEWFEGAIPKLG